MAKIRIISETKKEFALQFSCLRKRSNFAAQINFKTEGRRDMAKEGKELTPMMKQFFDLKAKHPDDSPFQDRH